MREEMRIANANRNSDDDEVISLLEVVYPTRSSYLPLLDHLFRFLNRYHFPPSKNFEPQSRANRGEDGYGAHVIYLWQDMYSLKHLTRYL